MNNKVKIKIESPLLRPGLTLETTVSMKYVEKATNELMDIARSINQTTSIEK